MLTEQEDGGKGDWHEARLESISSEKPANEVCSMNFCSQGLARDTQASVTKHPVL